VAAVLGRFGQDRQERRRVRPFRRSPCPRRGRHLRPFDDEGALAAHQVAAYLVSLLVLAVGVPDHIAWRLILGIGVLPSLLVLHPRRHMPESPRWTAQHGDTEQPLKDFETFTRRHVTVAAAPEESARRTGGLRGVFANRTFLVTLRGTAGSWFFFNVAVYGNSVQPATAHQEHRAETVMSSMASAHSPKPPPVGPGGLSSAITPMMPPSASASSVPGPSTTVVPFGVSLFGIGFGPHYTTMLLAAESYQRTRAGRDQRGADRPLCAGAGNGDRAGDLPCDRPAIQRVLTD
jgi:hypothetical protein